MRRKLLVVAGILVVLVVLLLMLTRQPAPPHVELGFHGFTNSPAGVNALFGISNHPSLAVGLHSISRLGTDPSKTGESPLGAWSWSRWETWGITSAINVKTTNEPLRIVFEFQERAVGLRRIPEVIQEVWGKITGNERMFFTGHKFLVTNDLPMAGVPR